MIVCHDHAWWEKPQIMDNWDLLLMFYGGDKAKASERMNTVTLDDEIKYAEQVGETTYTWNLDWLQQPEQAEVRNIRSLIPCYDLNNRELFDEVRKGVNDKFTKKQRRYLINQLYSQRANQQWDQVEVSEFVDALRRKLSFVKLNTFHDAYRVVAQILMTNKKISFAEKNYSWALLNGLKYEFQVEAETALIHGEGCKDHGKWIEGLKSVSFRHMSLIYERIRSLDTVPESVFLIREAVKVARRRLNAVARTTSWIEAQEDYLYSVESGDVRADQERIDDIMAASTFAKSASHLAGRVKEVLSAA